MIPLGKLLAQLPRSAHPSLLPHLPHRIVRVYHQIKKAEDDLTGAFYVGNGWVAGGMELLLVVMKWIIPENSLRKTHQ